MQAVLADPNAIAGLVFLAVAACGVFAAQSLAKRGDRHANLKRRLAFVSDSTTLSEGDDMDVDSDLFGADMEERRGKGRLAHLRDSIDHRLALIGGIQVLRKVLPIAAGIGVVAMLASLIKLDLPFKYALLLGILTFIVGSFVGLKTMLARTYEKFSVLFPDAIDLVVRSIRAGLPVSQALENIGNDIAAPVGPEFARISNQVRIGVSMDDALHDALKRIDMPEMRFFAVTLILQRETGGQLAEVLLNLSDILRQRKAMKMKIKALTSESRAASKIVAAIPFLSGIGMYYANKAHVMLLFEEPTGHNMLMYSVGSIVVGMLIIRKLTNVDA